MDLKEVLKVAIKGELEGKELYKSIAEKTSDKQAKQIFEHMSNEEQHHFDTLKEIYNHLSKNEIFSIPNLKKEVSFGDAESPIFSKEFKSRIKDKHYEMSALSIAIKLEYDSFLFYKEAGEALIEKSVASFFRYLSEWEKEHYDVLNKQMKQLETDYFDQNQFAPF